MARENRILVVDDSQENRAILADILGRQGYTVDTASDGQQALTYLRLTWFSCDLVITDLMMPGMSGIELLAKIRADSPWIQVVLISGHLDHEISLKAQMLGAFAVLPKPCSIEKLSDTVKLALLESTAAQGGGPHEKVDSPFDGASPCDHESPQCSPG